MVCHPCQEAGNLTTEAYGRRVTGVGPTYRERLKGQVDCGKFGEMLAVGSLLSHQVTRQGSDCKNLPALAASYLAL